jgi:membrane-bound lytic murein transglycosylase D
VVPLAPTAAPATRMVMYTARKGDTLVTIADRFGVSLNQLRRWNKMEGVKVEVGRRLHVAEPASAPSTAHKSHHATSGVKTAGSKAKAHETASTTTSSHAPASHSGAKKSGSPSTKNSHAVKAGSKTKSSAKKQK